MKFDMAFLYVNIGIFVIYLGALANSYLIRMAGALLSLVGLYAMSKRLYDRIKEKKRV